MSNKIYVYETSHSKKQVWEKNGVTGVGLIKIGMTADTVEDRIAAQMQGYPCTQEPQYTLLLITDAVTKSGSKFTDKDLHSILEQNNIYRLIGTEWFGCTVDDVLSAINSLDEKLIGTATITRIYEVLEKHKGGLTDTQIADILNLPISTIRSTLYGACKRHKKCFNRTKRFDKSTNKTRYFYTPTIIEDSNHREIFKHPYIEKRYLKFMSTYKLDWDKVFDILEGNTLGESTLKLSEALGVTHSTAEKFILKVREGLILSGELNMVDKRHYRIT